MDSVTVVIFQGAQIIAILSSLTLIFQWIHFLATLSRNHFTCGFLVISYLMSQTIHSIFGIIYYSLTLHLNLPPTNIFAEIIHAFLLSSTSLLRLTMLFFSIDCFCMTYFPKFFKAHPFLFVSIFGITVTTVSTAMIIVEIDAQKTEFIFDIVILFLQIFSVFLSKIIEKENQKFRKFSDTSNLTRKHQTARNLRFLRSFNPALIASTFFGVISSTFLIMFYFLNFPWPYLVGCYHIWYDICCLIISLTITKAIAISPAATWEMGLAEFLKKWIYRSKTTLIKIQTLEVRAPMKESADAYFNKLNQMWS